ncbi:MAG: YbjN domain-containing protein [Treponema sp.]|nr:YbjN domain-containing protein [Treponema sp.]
MVNSKIEQYLIDLMITYQQVDSNLWLLDDEEHALQGVAVMQAETIVIIRAEIMNVPKNNLLELYTKLLEINASDLVHGAYALENNKVVLIDTLHYDTMDYDDFRAVLDSFSLALTEHYPVLSKFREKSSSSEASSSGKAVGA